MACKPLALIMAGLLLTSTVAIANEESNQTAEKAAKELANPNTAYASLNLKLQYSGGYDGGEGIALLQSSSRRCHSLWRTEIKSFSARQYPMFTTILILTR